MTAQAVEIVVPVYNALHDLRACVESVLAHTQGPYSLVLIDDASPDPRIAAYFDELAARNLSRLTLLRNDRNLGFTGTANLGMTRSQADIVLLNSDTVVTRGWLDAIRRCAASDPRIGTITPFSNNAEICSFPRICENVEWPQGADPEPVRAALEAAAVPSYPDLPTGVGFCMFVRRALLDAIGAFDPAFGLGYGEENDLCLRAHAAGFRNVLCEDAFVLHTGGRSFAGAKQALGAQNTGYLVSRHPHYAGMVSEYIARDPLRPLREAALTAYDRMFSGLPCVLHVLHGGGGTEAHVRSLIDATKGRLRHVLATVRGECWRVEEHRADGSGLTSEFGRRDEEPPAEFLRMLCAVFGAGIVHVHNISGSRDRILAALPVLGIPYGCTVHDLNFACPTITLHRADGFYCGAVTDVATCQRCLSEQGNLQDVDIARWRERHGKVLERAAFVIAPSQWAADTLRRYFPAVAVTVIPHGLPTRPPRGNGATQVVLIPDDDVPTVAVLGAIGPDKGARRVERLAALAGQRGERIRFVVIGYLDRRQEAWQSEDGRLTVHGRYDPRELPALLDYYRAALVLFPSAGPETFSFTLSEAWSAGRSVLVPPIGALAERVDHHGAGWLLAEEEWRDEERMLDRMASLLSPFNAVAIENAGLRAAHMPLPSLQGMVDATMRAYLSATTNVDHAPVDRRRVVEASGYRSWTPEAIGASMAGSEREGGVPAHGLAHTAHRFARTALGRAIRRVMPRSTVDALRAKLR